MSLQDIKKSKWSVFVITSMANLGAAFAINSLNLALPFLREEFCASQAEVSWLALVYALLPCCCLLFFGRLADIYGYKRQYLLGFGFFSAASILAPLLSHSLSVLIFFRALQGIGYSMLISITQATIYRTFPPDECGRALGVNTVFVSVGFVSGPCIGGFLLEYFGWHAIFYFSAVFTVLGFFGAWFVLENDSGGKEGAVSLDLAGSIVFMAATGLFAVSLNSVGSAESYGRLLIQLGISALLFLLFVKIEKRAKYPLLPLELFRNKAFTLAGCASGLSYLTQQLTTYLFPFFLADVLLFSAKHAGSIMLTAPLLMMLMAPVGGALIDKKGTVLPAVIGLSMMGAACIGISFFTESVSIWFVIFVLMLVGAGNAFSSCAINTTILQSADRSMSGVASGALGTTRNIGNTMGIAFGSAMLELLQNHYSAGLSMAEAHLKAQQIIFLFGAGFAAAGILLFLKLSVSGESNRDAK